MLETRFLSTERLVLIVPKGHAFAQREAIDFRKVLNEPLAGLSHGSALKVHLAKHFVANLAEP